MSAADWADAIGVQAIPNVRIAAVMMRAYLVVKRFINCPLKLGEIMHSAKQRISVLLW
jgi:hypothetical protein